ncbi:MAG TPA: acetyl-CoA carboxylase biotin carboxyl carrier protein subunit [Bacteroidales bacterium]|nr:acetyl-CoA carboxylase biotin carboxyl carrier protein subunit [Bacteroidales bacterium]
MNKTLEIKIGDRIATLELLSRNGNKIEIKVDDKVYALDMLEVEKGVYSILKDHASYILEILQKDQAKHFEVHTHTQVFDVEVIDAESRYLLNRGADVADHGTLSISSPMPGKVVKIPVKIGDKVKEGTTVIIVEAMKMQSEYKVKMDREIIDILVKEGDAVNANQPLVIVE